MEYGLRFEKRVGMFVTETDCFQVNQFIWWAINSNTYVVCEKNSLLIVDPVDSEEFYQFVQKQTVQNALVILTHSHYDHISGLNRLRQIVPDTCVVASKICSDNIQTPKKNLSNIADAIISFQSRIDHKAELEELKETLVQPFSCAPADKTFETELELEWEGHSLCLSEFSGHSKDSVCCIMDNKYMFSGDTLLPIPTVTRLPGGSTARFWEEDMPKLERLQEQISMVFPGHEMPGTLKDMLVVNLKSARYSRLNNE